MDVGPESGLSKAPFGSLPGVAVGEAGGAVPQAASRKRINGNVTKGNQYLFFIEYQPLIMILPLTD